MIRSLSLGAHWQVRLSNQLWWWLGYLPMLLAGLLLAAFERRRLHEPFLAVSLAVLMVLGVAWLVRPRASLYATILLTTVSDASTVWWFPFAKNLSSWESIAYIADPVSISPLEISLVIGFTVTAIRNYAETRRLFVRTPLTWPVLTFTAFVLYGYVRGVVVGGGDLRIALFEGRAMFCLALVYFIAVSVCKEALHLRIALWCALAGVALQSLLAIQYYVFQLQPIDRDGLERLTEHGAAVGQNLVMVTLVGALLLGVSRRGRLMLLLASIPAIFVYLVAQRRAGIAALTVGIIMIMITLFWRRRQLFYWVAPITLVLGIGYLGAFWNSESTLGFPAQAIKPVIAPDQASLEDQNSDIYRMIEDFNLNYTIRTDPIRGLGFGQPFYQPVPLPDISFFEFHAYIPHNSILWLWIKTGFGGFVAMMYLFAKSIMLGADRVRKLPAGPDVVVALAGPLLVAMYAVFTYVDISWDPRNMVLVGLACAICAHSAPESQHARQDEEATLPASV